MPSLDIGEAALLAAAVDQQDRRALTRFRISCVMARELPMRADFEGVEPRPDPVERPEQRELQAVLLAVGPDHAVEQLLDAE